MDPASLSFGVVSLAMQMVQTIRVIRQYINAYKSAPKEIRHLSEKLETIVFLCDSLGTTISALDNEPVPRQMATLGTLDRMIKSCRDRVTEVYDVIKKIIPSDLTQQISSPVISARFLRHRADLRECDEQLGKSLQTLQFHISTSTLVMMATLPTRLGESSIVPVTLDATSHENDALQVLKRSPMKQLQKAQKRCQKLVWGRGYLFKWTSATTMGPNLAGGSNTVAAEEVSFLLGLPLCNLYMEFSLLRGSLAPTTFSCRLPHKVKHLALGSDMEFPSVLDAFYSDDLMSVQKAFSKRELTLHTEIIDRETTYSLLSFAVGVGARACAKFLMDHLSEDLGQFAFQSSFYQGATLGTMMAYIEWRGPSLTLNDFRNLLSLCHHGTDASRLIYSCQDSVSAEDMDEFKGIVILHVRRNVFDRYPFEMHPRFDKNSWDNVLRQILAKGPKFSLKSVTGLRLDGKRRRQKQLRREGWGWRNLNPFDSLNTVSIWASILGNHFCSAEVDEWFKDEYQWHLSFWDEPTHLASAWSEYGFKLIWGLVGGRQLPYWVPTVSKSCSVFELFNEFPNLKAYDTIGWWTYMLEDSDFIFWVRDDSPFQPSRWMMSGLLPFERGRARVLMETRFHRKQMKRLRRKKKMRRKMGEFEPERAMPGSWLDEFDM